MIVLVLVLALLLLASAGVLALTDRARRRSADVVHRMRSERDARAQRAEAVRDRAIDARQEAEVERDEALARAAKADAALAAAEATAAELSREVPAPGADTDQPATAETTTELDALWALTLLRTDWSQRRSLGLSTATPIAADADPLAKVLTAEVEQLRDDAGIPGTVRVALTPEASAAESVLVVAATSALLANLARWCDGYDLFVHRFEDRIVAVVVCDGFSGPDIVADETSELLAAVSTATGDLDVDRDPGGRLRARLSIPAGRAPSS